MADKSLTAALAVIKVVGYDGKSYTIGKMKNIRVNESFTRGRVVGLGEINPSEIPVLGWNGTVNVSQYAIDLNSGVLYSLARNFSSVSDFVQNLLFNDGIAISILRKIKNADGTFGFSTFATIGGRDATFEYTTPILYAS